MLNGLNTKSYAAPHYKQLKNVRMGFGAKKDDGPAINDDVVNSIIIEPTGNVNKTLGFLLSGSIKKDLEIIAKKMGYNPSALASDVIKGYVRNASSTIGQTPVKANKNSTSAITTDETPAEYTKVLLNAVIKKKTLEKLDQLAGKNHRTDYISRLIESHVNNIPITEVTLSATKHTLPHEMIGVKIDNITLSKLQDMAKAQGYNKPNKLASNIVTAYVQTTMKKLEAQASAIDTQSQT